MLGQVKYAGKGRDRVSKISRPCTDFFSKHSSSVFQECFEQNCAVFALTKRPPVFYDISDFVAEEDNGHPAIEIRVNYIVESGQEL